jgi:NADH-quinone oxidoreductase subunit N
MILAQATTVELTVPDVEWASFAPETAIVAVALILLLFAVAGRRRMLVAVPAAVLGLGAGVALIAAGEIVGGAVAVVLGAAALALTIGLGSAPAMIHDWLAGLGALAALVLTVWQAVGPMDATATSGLAVSSTMGGSVALDGIALYTRLTVYTSTLLVFPLGYAYLRERGIHKPEFEPLLLLSAAGMGLLGAANDLITLFVALEILSIALYVMAGMARQDRRSQESSLKYFLMGAVASAILLYGMALLYVATGSLDIAAIGQRLGVASVPLRVGAVGMVLMLVGLGFKVALVPFHAWTPDVYEGAPTNVTAFMAAATKAAGFAALLRVFLLSFGRYDDLWVPVVAVLAGITMLYGAVVAIAQRDVKRILAFSALAHAGYAAIGVAANSEAGISATLWYLLTYAVTTIAAFGVVIALERQTGRAVSLVDLKGMAKTSPALAGIFTVALLSLAGVPPTVGFLGKLQVFTAGVASGLTWLVVIGVGSSVIAGFFYLRLMGAMYLEEPDEHAVEPDYPVGWSLAVNLATVLIIFLGLQPGVLLDLAAKSAELAR